MEITRRNTEIRIDLDKEEDRLGLFAVLTGRTDLATPEQLQRGQFIYAQIYGHVHELATNYESAVGLKKVG